MFGHRYFGARYFGPRYWGVGAPAPDDCAWEGPGGDAWGVAWSDAWGCTPEPPVVVVDTTVRSKGWPGDYYHPTWESKRKRAETVQEDLVRAYEDATGITAEREREAAIRELERAAAEASKVGDERLAALSEQIMALSRFGLEAGPYLDRVGEILAQLQEQENDDMETLQLIARMI